LITEICISDGRRLILKEFYFYSLREQERGRGGEREREGVCVLLYIEIYKRI
jgi:hypothetical protein